MEQKVEVKFLSADKFEIKTIPLAITIYADKSHDGYSPAGPNPLELFLSALGSCLGVYAKRYLQRHTITFTKLIITLTADFTQESPARLINIKASIDTDAALGVHKDTFLRFVNNCPVHNTIAHTKNIVIELVEEGR